MRLYLAARYDRRKEIAEIAAELGRIGHTVTSRWLRGKGRSDGESAGYDLNDILASDGLILFSEDPTRGRRLTGGRLVEFGFAIGRRKQIFIVGPRENIFCDLPDVERFETTTNMLTFFSAVPTVGLSSVEVRR